MKLSINIIKVCSVVVGKYLPPPKILPRFRHPFSSSTVLKGWSQEKIRKLQLMSHDFFLCVELFCR